MSEQAAATVEREPFSVDHWAEFWADPKAAMARPEAGSVLAEEVVGHWPGRSEPLRGKEQYLEALVELLAAYPDLRLKVLEHAEGDGTIFIYWRASATGPEGPVEFDGIDRFLIEDGLVADSVIRFDPAILASAFGSD